MCSLKYLHVYSENFVAEKSSFDKDSEYDLYEIK
jgi:hypothetical protein